MFTLCQIDFAQTQKPYRIGLLFTLKNGDFGAISVTEHAGLGTSHTQHVVSQHQNKPWEWYQFPERDKLKSGAKLNSCLQSLFLLSSQAGQSAVNKRLGTVVETHIFAEVEAAVGPLAYFL